MMRDAAHPDVAKVLRAYCPKNVALMRELAAATEPDDDGAVMWLCLGLPMLGWAPAARGLMRRVLPPSTTIDERRADREGRNEDLIRTIRSSGDESLDKTALENDARSRSRHN